MWKWMPNKSLQRELTTPSFITLILLIFVGQLSAGVNSEIAPTNATATPDLNDDGAVDLFIVASGANANARLSLDLVPNGGAGNRRNDGIASGEVSGRGTTIAIEVFATGVTTPLIGMQIVFDFDASLLTFSKAENSAFSFVIPQGTTGTSFASGAAVTLPSSGFLARAEFTTSADVTGREFSIGISMVTLSESLSSSDEITTTNRIAFNTTPPPPPFSLSLDGDDTAGDQAVTTLDVAPGAVATIQVFGTGIRQATGISARFEYDSAQVTYEGFDAGDVLPNAQVLSLPSSNPTAIEISLVSFGTRATADSGMVGSIRFRTMSAFSGTTLRLVHAELGRGTQRERVAFADARITLQPAAPTPDFNGDGQVDFADFLLFTAQFGLRRGDAGFDARFDLDGDGTIGFGDFLIFGSAFGQGEA